MQSRPGKKTLLIGPENAGKSSISEILLGNDFNPEYSSTIGIEFRRYCLGEEEYPFTLWDTAGESRFDTITQTCYKGSDIGIFVLDANWIITNDNLSVKKIFRLIQRYQTFKTTAPNTPTILLVNKIDLVLDKLDLLQSTVEQSVRKYAAVDRIVYFSAKSRLGIEGLNDALYALSYAQEDKNILEAKGPQAFNPADKMSSFMVRQKANAYFAMAMQNIMQHANIDNDLTWPVKGIKSYQLFMSIKNLAENAENLTAEDHMVLARAAQNLTSQLVNNKELTESDINNFANTTYKYRRNSGWVELLGAIIGAAIGFVTGAMLGAWMGPTAAVSAVLAGAKGAVIGASIAGAGGMGLGAWTSFWVSSKRCSVNQVVESAELYVTKSRSNKLI
jgi:small GTP-binding protein